MSFTYQNAPVPSVPLNGHCSVIYNSNGVDTLYAFQANAFQSLPLQSNATWSTLAPGVAVNGAKCVLGQWNHQDALIVVGGTATDPAQKDFPGLQYYTFATKQWANIPPGTSVVQNRLMHGAAFLPSTNTLLVYSGFQDNSFTQSSETFTIVAEPPYVSSAHPAGAPLATNPIVLPWNTSHAAMMGGSANNRAVWLFSSSQGWEQLGVSVPTIVTNLSAVSAATLNTANDGKVLQLFDLQATPNTVTSLDIQSSDSNPTGKAVVTRDEQLPTYNGTLASSVERVGYSLAQSPSSGLVVASGGAGNAAASVVLFNQTANSWISPQAFFAGASNGNGQLQSPLASSSTASSTATSATSSAVSTTSASLSTTTSPTSIGSPLPSSTTAASDGGLSSTNRTILGGVLGGLAGFGALLILLLLFFRSRRQRRRDRNAGLSDDKSRLEFDDSAAVANYPRAGSGASKRSAKDEWKRMPTAEEKLGAAISKPNFVSDSLSPIGDGLNSQTQPLIANASPLKSKSDDGWNKYFAKGGNSKDITSEDRLRMDSVSHQTEYTSSHYDIASHTASIYQDQETALLDPNSKMHPAHVRRPSSDYRSDHRLSEEPETFLDPASSSSGTQAWESLGAGDGQSAFDLRPTSSIYAESMNFPHPGNKVHIAGEEQSFASDATKGSSNPNSWRTDSRGMRTMASKDLTGGGALSSRPQKDDMSWLNLGKN